MEFIFELDRFSMTPFYTLGKFVLSEGGCPLLSGYTLELPWKDNAQGRSCIPAGRYGIIWNKSQKFQDRYSKLMPLVVGVEKRDGIRIHPGNRTSEIRGCILVGTRWALHSPTTANVYDSRRIYNRLVDITCPNEIQLIIRETR